MRSMSNKSVAASNVRFDMSEFSGNCAVNYELVSGITAAAITCVYCGVSYPWEVWLAWHGRSSMSVAFPFAATLTFASWVVHSLLLEKTNFWILVPNATGLVFAALLTSVLIFRRQRSNGDK